jgi:hypothetical protein
LSAITDISGLRQPLPLSGTPQAVVRRVRFVTALLTGLLAASCVVSYGRAKGGMEGRAAAAFGETETDSRDDIDVAIDFRERPLVVPGVTRVGVVFDVEVTNRSSETLTLRRVQLQSVTDEAAMAPLTGARFKNIIPPGQKTSVQLSAFFEVDSDNPLPIEGPMIIRAVLFLRDPAGNETQETFTRNIGSGGIGVKSRP